MRLVLAFRLLGLVPALLLAAREGRAQGEAEVRALAKRFPAARYGALVAQPATRGPHTEHRTWRPTTAGRWRWPATVRVGTAQADGRVLNVFTDALRPLSGAGTSAALPDAARGARLTEQYVREQLPPAAQPGATVRAPEAVWYVTDSATGAERAGWLVTWGHPDSRVGAWEVVLDEATGQPAFPPRDLLCYHQGSFEFRVSSSESDPPAGTQNSNLRTQNFTDTTATALVFRPDPLTTAQQPYGRPYVDSLDTDRPALNQQRVAETLFLTFAADSFRLRNSAFELAEFDPPARPVVAARTAAGLQFGRADAGFEQVNALFHLTRARQYLGQLGHGALHAQRIRVDASGLSGADQSRFSPLDTTLSYGEGGVDDAEDADVLVHEYGHALAFAAAPGTNVGLERRTLDEANADYWAAVHSARLGGANAFGREQLFNWDGHNEFWAGRWVISPKKYPHDLVGSMYLDADVWSATLWQIRAALPAVIADRLFLQHLYGYAPNLTMPQAASLFLQADTLLYGAAHAATIFQFFDDRHILGSHVVVGEEYDPLASDGIRVWATDAFARGAAARVWAPTGAQLVLLNATGARVWEGRAGDANVPFREVPGHDLASGVYLLRILSPNGARTVRLVRW